MSPYISLLLLLLLALFGSSQAGCPDTPAEPGPCSCVDASGFEAIYIICSSGTLQEVMAAVRDVNMEIFELQITGVEMATLPHDAFAGVSIRRMSLPGNKIRRITAHAFRGLEDSLEFLSLYDNELTSMPTKALASLHSLCGLDVGRNRLDFSNPALFNGLNTLEFVSLRDSYLTAVPADALASLVGLNDLDLGMNSITDVDVESFGALRQQLLTLRLYGNRWVLKFTKYITQRVKLREYFTTK
ncbi:PREDICTED: leucine-rich repeat-containing G-protein coupled receptor 5-like [Priapulus caudatus]|uniref:Leucine-rich repeat-containing G-protein coupled receptor 5-like n=1 Tax=Priapulus caudatus TaxID=37621 RepID=A0ABM1E981_PRICU|nr:PREDICTED: leucine-rich repeat-containing G-protein coupled receptor 5-like [Priapulus caudatus]